MKKRIVLLLAAAMITATAFAGCGGASKDDFARTYVQGILDALYLGQYNKDFLSITDYESTEQLEEEYENGILEETDYFAYYFNVSTLSDVSRADLIDLYKEIYSFSKYQVNPSVDSEGIYTVEVIVSPIDVIQKVMQEDIPDYMASLQKLYENGTSNGLTEAEYEDIYVSGIIALIKERMANIGYLEDHTVPVPVVKDQTSGLYFAQRDALSKIDENIIKY